MQIHSEAIVISALKYSEADLIVKCYTQTSGLKTYLLRGILKSKKGKFKASMFQPFTQLEIHANHKDKGTLEYMQEAKIVYTYQSLHTNIVKSTLVLFLSEILRNSIQEEEQNESLYQFLKYSMNWLDEHAEIANFHLLFMLKLTQYLGFYPDDSDMEHLYFNMLEGVFQDSKTNNYCVQGYNVTVLQQFLKAKFEDIQHIKLSKEKRSDFLDMMILYFQLHIESFKKPKSLAVFQEIFN